MRNNKLSRSNNKLTKQKFSFSECWVGSGEVLGLCFWCYIILENSKKNLKKKDNKRLGNN